MNNIEYKIDSKESFDLIIIGNMTKDYLNDSSDFQLGGPSLYAGITASKLGLKTLLISNHTINKNYFNNFPLLNVLNMSRNSDTEFLNAYNNFCVAEREIYLYEVIFNTKKIYCLL